MVLRKKRSIDCLKRRVSGGFGGSVYVEVCTVESAEWGGAASHAANDVRD